MKTNCMYFVLIISVIFRSNSYAAAAANTLASIHLLSWPSVMGDMRLKGRDDGNGYIVLLASSHSPFSMYTDDDWSDWPQVSVSGVGICCSLVWCLPLKLHSCFLALLHFLSSPPQPTTNASLPHHLPQQKETPTVKGSVIMDLYVQLVCFPYQLGILIPNFDENTQVLVDCSAIRVTLLF